MSGNIETIEGAINRRFFMVIHALSASESVTSLSGFCVEHGFSASAYRELRLEFGVTPTPGYVSRYRTVSIAALHYLVLNYGVSGDWLLSGKGQMFLR